MGNPIQDPIPDSIPDSQFGQDYYLGEEDNLNFSPTSSLRVSRTKSDSPTKTRAVRLSLVERIESAHYADDTLVAPTRTTR